MSTELQRDGNQINKTFTYVYGLHRALVYILTPLHFQVESSCF